MEKITKPKFIELILAATKLTINGIPRSDVRIHSTYIATKMPDGDFAYLRFKGNKYFYDNDNKIIVETNCYPVYITLN